MIATWRHQTNQRPSLGRCKQALALEVLEDRALPSFLAPVNTFSLRMLLTS
jgi:hypothetical protein